MKIDKVYILKIALEDAANQLIDERFDVGMCV
jgi:hypothetical protein